MYNVNIDDNYTVPEGELTKEQYVEFVMNMAAESYTKQYNTASKEAGIQAALDKYNESVQPAE